MYRHVRTMETARWQDSLGSGAIPDACITAPANRITTVCGSKTVVVMAIVRYRRLLVSKALSGVEGPT